jgi:hypothetical protein
LIDLVDSIDYLRIRNDSHLRICLLKDNAFREFEGRTADVPVVLVEKGMKKML